MYPPRHPAPQSPQTAIGCESGTLVPRFAGHPATTSGSLRISTRTNNGAGANIAVPGIPSHFVRPTPTPGVPTPPRGPPAPPRASAGWPTAGNPAAAPLIPPAALPWPVPNSTRHPEQHNVLQATHRALYRNVQENASPPSRMRHVMVSGPSSAPGLRPYVFRPPPNASTDAGALAPVYNGPAGQRSYAAGAASTVVPNQFPNQMPTSLDPLNYIQQAPASPEVGLSIKEDNSLALGQASGPGFAAPLTGYLPGNPPRLCVCTRDYWFASCDLAWEHYNVAMNSPIPTISLPCSCFPGLSPGQIPKGCPVVADHLLYWLNRLTTVRANEFRIAVAGNHITPGGIYQAYEGAGSQVAAVDTVKSPSREMNNLQAAREAQRSFSESTSPAQLLHATQPSFSSLSMFETPTATRDTGQPSDVDVKPALIAPHQAPPGGDPHSAPGEVITVSLSDVVGTPAGAPARQSGGAPAGLSKRRKASLNAVIPSAKRARRAPQPSVAENTGTHVNAMDEARGFVNPNLDPEVQKAMRDLVVSIRASPFFADNDLEPNIGTHDAVELMAVASPELWQAFGTKAKSIYSLFIRVDGKECKCLWCGDVQQGKLQRAVGHFRAKHLAHEPYLCGEAHVGEEICNVRFATLEALGEHKRRKDKLRAKGKLQCSGCERSYTSVSNLNRHRGKCGSNQTDPERDDDE